MLNIENYAKKEKQIKCLWEGEATEGNERPNAGQEMTPSIALATHKEHGQ